MAGYDDPAEELYYMDDTAGSFDQDLVYALDAGVRHSVNQALVQAIQPIKHHLLGLVEQQAWAAPGRASTLEDPSLAAIPQSEKQLSNPHAADFQSLIRNMAREHDYNAGSHKKGKDVPPSSSSSSEPSSEQKDAPPRKRKKKAHHQEVPTPKNLVAVFCPLQLLPWFFSACKTLGFPLPLWGAMIGPWPHVAPPSLRWLLSVFPFFWMLFAVPGSLCGTSRAAPGADSA
ncbi:hypothetical protein NDU88_006360 [Pleurodeles waltl]|uniref:Uncharacterized protein n=1 Tax=Pleurodeles waltl TaxID=8319 RepID=A0AAV7X0G0_PLEWA|nr:hypothetical protein NDU88_006360 [Pleurodeles waltl]